MLSVDYGTSGALIIKSHAMIDAVKNFFHTLDQEPYSFFNFKATLYNHFQVLLATPDKALLLTDANFAAKVITRLAKYPACDINTANLFDEDGDPIFNFAFPFFKERSFWRRSLMRAERLGLCRRSSRNGRCCLITPL